MPCNHWPVPLGTLEADRSFADIVESSSFLAEVRQRRNKDRHGCGTCAGKEECHFCPGQSWHEKRDGLAPAAAICADTYGKVVAKARQQGQPLPPKPPGLRASPFRVLNGAQAACSG